jgi:hypothetical protein
MTAGRLIGATVTLALAVVALSIAGLVALNTGFGVGAPPFGFGLEQGYDEAARGLMTGRPSRGRLARAQELARRAVAIAPYASAARLRLVYADTLANGRLTAQGAAAFARSYDLAPIDPDVAAWRIRFGLEHWESLSADARASVEAEARAFMPIRAPAIDVPAILSSIHDPSGRLAAAYWMRNWGSSATPPPKNRPTR